MKKSVPVLPACIGHKTHLRRKRVRFFLFEHFPAAGFRITALLAAVPGIAGLCSVIFSAAVFFRIVFRAGAPGIAGFPALFLYVCSCL